MCVLGSVRFAFGLKLEVRESKKRLILFLSISKSVEKGNISLSRGTSCTEGKLLRLLLNLQSFHFLWVCREKQMAF